jgi:hypothetical protein
MRICKENLDNWVGGREGENIEIKQNKKISWVSNG